MKIVPIFASKLFSFHYPQEAENEYDRLTMLWNDPEYLFEYAEKNESFIHSYLSMSIEKFINCILDDVDILEEMLETHFYGKSLSLNMCFQPLYDKESQCKRLSLQKRKCKYLRIYAIKIDEDCFVITGGAIKLAPAMQDHPDMIIELQKLNNCKNYLQANDVFDNDSFFELIS